MRAINSGIMKQANRKMVLNCIRRQPISRAELADYTQLTRASITQIVDALMNDGLVIESVSVGKNRLGRRRMQLEIVKDGRYIAGVNISRRNYELGVINLRGEVLWRRSGVIVDRSVEEVLDEIAAAFRDSVQELNLSGDVVYGMGITTPGPLDPASGTILNPPNFSAWHNVPITEMLRRRTGWEAWLDNVSCAHALDELYFGIGRTGAQNFTLMRVDEGVGTGVVLGGKLFTGPRGRCPEIGHIPLNPNGALCACGNRGCLEQHIAFPAVLDGTPFASWQQVMDNLDADPEAAALFHRVARDLAFGMLNIINIFSVDRIVLSGNFAPGGDRLCEAINHLLRGKGLHTVGENPVVPGGKMEYARIAAMPAYHNFFFAD